MSGIDDPINAFPGLPERPVPAPIPPAEAADLFGAATEAERDGRATLARAVDMDETMSALADGAGEALWTAARAIVASYTGPVGATVADAARVIVEREVRRRAGA